MFIFHTGIIWNQSNTEVDPNDIQLKLGDDILSEPLNETIPSPRMMSEPPVQPNQIINAPLDSNKPQKKSFREELLAKGINFKSSKPTQRGILHVHIIEAKNLMPGDLNGYSF